MGERAIEPGRYAQLPDGSWVPFAEGDWLPEKPIAVITVKAVKPVAVDEQVRVTVDVAAPPMAILPDSLDESGNLRPKVIELPVDTRGRAEVPASHPIAKKLQRDIERKAAARTKPVAHLGPSADMAVGDAKRTATPVDVFRAVADQFGILPATGNARSCARFKPLVRRDEEAEAARGFERGVEERQAKR